MNEKLIIKPHELAVQLGVSTVTLWRWQKSKAHGFPTPIYRGNRTLGWRVRDINDWLDSQ
ncbi:helix-turn-helix transcriptional regulator [Vibrio sonorensis]|uniref:helix-turn-helix transcriptional regulator n=1 Tax=Vibrio sonorensis TaxID=1004316 RepID=UPI0008D9678C|nr:AlpA family phage regulatory protein [Vibrio sonorensis]